MSNTEELKKKISDGGFDKALARVYPGCADLSQVRTRYNSLADLFGEIFPDAHDADIRLFSAPGRTEICGNHTDHNRGMVLAAAIDLDAVAAAAKTDDMRVSVKSAEYAKTDVVDLSVLTPVENETGRSVSLIRGTAARFKELGYNIGGFDCTTMTKVLSGSGMSSSAAFEVLIGTVMNYLYNDGRISAEEIAKIAQYSENNFFGKPCGLMDQMACSVGGFVEIDFRDSDKPVITRIPFDLSAYGYKLCIVDTKATHADLTDEYAAIRTEMESVAGVFGKSALRDVNENDFMDDIDNVRKKTSERAVLRAMHFFAENKRVAAAAKALNNGDFDKFLRALIDSGDSSFKYNQNVFSSLSPKSQPVSLALAVSEYILKGRGAWRVHGGGFAGTIQAFVPDDMLEEYKSKIEAIFGQDTCYVLTIRALGGCEVK